MEQAEDILVQHPLVSIHCLVYNHERFLRDCLEGFVNQETNFPFEAIVHDDASTDHSAEIIREYAEKYPHIIRPIYQSENQYSKKNGSIGRAMSAARSPYSEYVAYCEGDDYWTSPSKLQKQVNFMEQHPEYTMCFHAALKKWENGEEDDSLVAEVEDRSYAGEEIYETWPIATCSMLVRRSVLKSELYQCAHACREFYAGDILVQLSAAALGKIRGMSEVMSVYRKHEGGVVFNPYVSFDWRARIRHYKAITRFFGKNYQRMNKLFIRRTYIDMAQVELRRHEYVNAASFFARCFLEMPFLCLEYFVRSIARVLRKITRMERLL